MQESSVHVPCLMEIHEGIGAEYPLSAVITAEWSSTSSRVTMLSSVFLMQPVGQALAQLVGVWVVLGRDNQYHMDELQCGINTLHDEECKTIVDGIWRIIIGSGAVPALLAIIFRFFLFDCGLYTLEVKAKPGTAFRDTQRIYGAPSAMPNGFGLNSPNTGRSYSDQPPPVQFSIQDLRNYFIRDGNWYYLLGKSTISTLFPLDRPSGPRNTSSSAAVAPTPYVISVSRADSPIQVRLSLGSSST